jgi:photosynthetic reaction center cytochrome c subunit
MASSRQAFGVMAAVAAACFIVEIGAAAQSAPAQTAADKVPLSDEVFKSVQILKGIPVDTFFEAMGMFASSMGNDCTFCHVKDAYFDKTAFAQVTPRMQRARQMMTMMNDLNERYFAGRTRVTCFTCHRGSQSPVSEPDLSIQYGEPFEDPNARDFPVETRVTADQLFDKYVQAIGGADRVARLTSYVGRGTYEGFDTAFEKRPVEIYAKAPNQQTTVVQLATGRSTRVFDGRSGWMAGGDQPVPLLTLTEGNLDRARLEAIVSFPAGIKQAFPRWRVGRTAIDGNEVYIVQGMGAAQALANFYFDQAGLLVRFVRWTRTPVGFIPTQVDFADYRDVAGVKVPFDRKVTQTYMQAHVLLTQVQPNVAIEASRFAQPAPVTPVSR